MLRVQRAAAVGQRMACTMFGAEPGERCTTFDRRGSAGPRAHPGPRPALPWPGPGGQGLLGPGPPLRLAPVPPPGRPAPPPSLPARAGTPLGRPGLHPRPRRCPPGAGGLRPAPGTPSPPALAGGGHGTRRDRSRALAPGAVDAPPRRGRGHQRRWRPGRGGTSVPLGSHPAPLVRRLGRPPRQPPPLPPRVPGGRPGRQGRHPPPGPGAAHPSLGTGGP